MQRRTLFWLSFLWVPTAIASRDKRSDKKKKCDAINRRLKKIESRMRAGYSAKQGRRLKENRRELVLRRFREC